MIYWG